MKFHRFVSSIVVVVMAICFVLCLAAPALAAGNDAPNGVTCKYGSIGILNSRTHIITYRCKTAGEYYSSKFGAVVRSAITGAQNAYEGKVTQPVTKAGTNLAAPAVKNTEVQNAACLLKGGSACYGGQ